MYKKNKSTDEVTALTRSQKQAVVLAQESRRIVKEAEENAKKAQQNLKKFLKVGDEVYNQADKKQLSHYEQSTLQVVSIEKLYEILGARFDDLVIVEQRYKLEKRLATLFHEDKSGVFEEALKYKRTDVIRFSA